MRLTNARGARRVVVTGMGIVSCLGNTLDAVADALREGRPGVARVEAWRERGFGSQVGALASVEHAHPFARKFERLMGDTARFAAHAAQQAIDHAGLDASALHSPRAGVVIGSGIGSMQAYDIAMHTANTRGVDRVLPYVVPQAMGSTAAASVAHLFDVQGVSYAPSAACTTSSLAIGQAMQLIESGRQDVMLAGGSEAMHDNMTLMFDAMGALSRGFNDTPQQASRPYDTARDGFVIGSGAGVLVLESLEHALARGAHPVAELTGFFDCTDAGSMFAPRAAGIERALRGVLDGLDANAACARPDYVNTHAPSTPAGDIEELRALIDVFGGALPAFSSTKGLSGHPLGACGAHEAIYTLLMMRDGFVAGNGRVASREALLDGLPLVETTRAARIDRAMSIAFGFGGNCAVLTFDQTFGG